MFDWELVWTIWVVIVSTVIAILPLLLLGFGIAFFLDWKGKHKKDHLS